MPQYKNFKNFYILPPKTLQKINTQNNNINNTQNNNINNTNNNIQNINNNINNNINVTYVKFGNENLSEILSEKEIQIKLKK